MVDVEYCVKVVGQDLVSTSIRHVPVASLVRFCTKVPSVQEVHSVQLLYNEQLMVCMSAQNVLFCRHWDPDEKQSDQSDQLFV